MRKKKDSPERLSFFVILRPAASGLEAVLEEFNHEEGGGQACRDRDGARAVPRLLRPRVRQEYQYHRVTPSQLDKSNSAAAAIGPKRMTRR